MLTKILPGVAAGWGAPEEELASAESAEVVARAIASVSEQRTTSTRRPSRACAKPSCNEAV